MLTPEQVTARWPAFTPAPDEVAVFEEQAGYLCPELCIQANQAVAVAHGAVLKFGTQVTGWDAYVHCSCRFCSSTHPPPLCVCVCVCVTAGRGAVHTPGVIVDGRSSFPSSCMFGWSRPRGHLGRGCNLTHKTPPTAACYVNGAGIPPRLRQRPPGARARVRACSRCGPRMVRATRRSPGTCSTPHTFGAMAGTPRFRVLRNVHTPRGPRWAWPSSQPQVKEATTTTTTTTTTTATAKATVTTTTTTTTTPAVRELFTVVAFCMCRVLSCGAWAGELYAEELNVKLQVMRQVLHWCVAPSRTHTPPVLYALS